MGKNQKNCDCCCTPGVYKELERIIGRRVLIRNNTSFLYTFGTLVSVDCDIARVETEFGLSSIPVCGINWLAELPENNANNQAFFEALGQLK